jgi:hypothetical protein
MAFDRSKMSLVQYAGDAFQIWRYTTGDTRTAVGASGYFNGFAGKLNVGDRLMIAASDGEVDRTVDSNDGSTVTTAAVA